MRVFVLIVLPLAAWCAPAQLTETEDESSKPLIRTKRAGEEIVFGNHQNNAQLVKKSDPMLDVKGSEGIIDKKAETSKDVHSEVNKMAEDIKEDKTTEEEDDQSPAEDSTDEEESSSGEMEQEVNSGKDLKDYVYDYNYYPYVRTYRYRRNTKTKPQELLTAEHMTPNLDENAAVSAARSKRDLTTDEIAEWLENGVGRIEDPRDFYDYETPDYDATAGWDNLGLSQLLDEYADVYQDENPVDYDDYNRYDEGPADPDNKELLSLLEYLVANEAPKETNALPQIYPEDVQEEWEDIEEEDDVTPYEPLVYNGVPGVFIPMESENVVSKRQYMSMVPGVRKRNDFYPYSLEPEGGRWGAFVDQVEEKRTADAFDRLLRMAQALNPPSQRYYDEYRK